MQGFFTLSAEPTEDLGLDQLEDADDDQPLYPAGKEPESACIEGDESKKEEEEEEVEEEEAAADAPLVSPRLPEGVPNFWHFKVTSSKPVHVQTAGYRTFMDQIGFPHKNARVIP